MPKAIIAAYEYGQGGPTWTAAYQAYNFSDVIGGSIAFDANNPSTKQEMAKLGISAPCIVIGRYCSAGGQTDFKAMAKMTGTPSPQAIANAAESIAQNEHFKNCEVNSGPLTTAADSGSGDDDTQSGFGLNPWGIFSLPFDAPWWIWAAIAGGAAIGSTSANGKVGRYGWGAVAVIAGGNAINAYKASE